MNEETISKFLIQELSIITQCNSAQIDLDKSLYDNGVNSIRFVELLLAIQRQWQLDYLNDNLLSSDDVSSLRKLINKIANDLG
jgi:acyl carrier protein